MSVLTVGGRKMAAGLEWEAGSSRMQVRQALAASDRRHMVQVDTQIGFAADEEKPSGVVPLAGVLRKVCPGNSWLALVADDGGERFALVRQVGGTLLADGDRVYEEREAAVEAFDEAKARIEARGAGGGFLATPGLLAEDGQVGALEVGTLAAAAKGLKTVRRVRGGGDGSQRGLWILIGVLVLAMGGGGAWYFEKEVRELVYGPPKPPTPKARFVTAATDTGSLLEGCAAALSRNLLHLGGWQAKDLDCYARFTHGQISGVLPDLRNRPVLLVVWKLGPGLEAPAHRRLAERALSGKSGWDAYQVSEGTVWAVSALRPVIREYRRPPAYREWREALERSFALRGVQIQHRDVPADPGGAASVVLTSHQSLAALKSMADAVPGLEVVRVTAKQAGWAVLARKEQAERLSEPVFERLKGAFRS